MHKSLKKFDFFGLFSINIIFPFKLSFSIRILTIIPGNPAPEPISIISNFLSIKSYICAESLKCLENIDFSVFLPIKLSFLFFSIKNFWYIFNFSIVSRETLNFFLKKSISSSIISGCSFKGIFTINH